jgi:transposase
LSDFERGQIIVAHLTGESVKRIATLLGVSRATGSKVMSTYTHYEKTSSAKRSSERKSTLTERNVYILRRIASKNHRTTATQVTA